MKSGQHKKGHTNEPTSKLPIRTLPCNPNRTLNHCRCHPTPAPHSVAGSGTLSERWSALRVPLTAEIAHSKRSARIRTSSRPPHSRVQQQLRTYGDVPRPFVIDPLDTRGEYRQGESFAFRLILIGRAIDYLPYFLVSFRELGEIGMGKGRGRFQLTQVLTEGGESIYDGDTQMVHNRNNTLCFDEDSGGSGIFANRRIDRAPAHPHASHTRGANNG